MASQSRFGFLFDGRAFAALAVLFGLIFASNEARSDQDARQRSDEAAAKRFLDATGVIGNAAEYELTLPDKSLGTVTIAIRELGMTRVQLEYKLEYTIGRKARELYQLVKWENLKRTKDKSDRWDITEILVLGDEIKVPERIPPVHLKTFGDLLVSRVLFRDRSKDAGSRVGKDREELTVFGNKFKANHYQWTDSQVTEKLDYWLTPEVPPFGILKIESQTPRADEAIMLVFKRSLPRVVFAIDPAKAVAQTPKGLRVMSMFPRR